MTTEFDPVNEAQIALDNIKHSALDRARDAIDDVQRLAAYYRDAATDLRAQADRFDASADHADVRLSDAAGD